MTPNPPSIPPAAPPPSLPPALVQALDAIRVRRRWLLLLCGTCDAILVLGLGLVLQAALDAGCHPHPTERWLLSLACDAGALLVLVLRAWRRRCARCPWSSWRAPPSVRPAAWMS